MNTNDLLVRWSALSLEEIEARLQAGTDKEAVEQFLGPEEAEELHAMALEPRARDLRETVVLLPGIMGTLLTSIRGMTTLLWINPLLFIRGQSRLLELNEDGTSDGSPEIEAVPIALEKMTYVKAALKLRRQVDLFEFPYDWRRPIEWNADVLSRCIERWSAGDEERQFTLVGHSMGGIVSRAYLARHQKAAETLIKQVITHGTPHFGAAGAVENMILGNRMMDIVTRLNSKNVPKRFLRNLPSVYQLLPAPQDLFPNHRPYPANWDLYRASEWRLEGIRQDYLDAARGFHRLLASADPQVEIAQIAGSNLETVVEVQRRFGPDGMPEYDFIRVEEGPDSGDGTVPLWSAILPGATVYYIEEVHRDLPKNKRVIEATLDLIHGEKPALPTELPTRRAVRVGRPIPPPVDVEAERIRGDVEVGTATEEELSQLFFAL